MVKIFGTEPSGGAQVMEYVRFHPTLFTKLMDSYANEEVGGKRCEVGGDTDGVDGFYEHHLVLNWCVFFCTS